MKRKTAYLGLFAAVAIIFGYVESLVPVYDYLASHEDDEKYRYTMVGYELGNTVTDNGHVARVCAT